MSEANDAVNSPFMESDNFPGDVVRLCHESPVFLRESLQKRFARMQNQTGLLLKESVEGIHDMRVASRRLRAALSEFRPYFEPVKHGDFLNRVRKVTKLLGRPRELDVMEAMIGKFKLQLKGPWLDAADCALHAIQKSRRKASPQCREALAIVEVPEFQAAFESLLTTCTEGHDCMLRVPPERLERRLKQLKNRYAQWQESEDEPHLHEVRIAYKKLRYTCEIYEPLYGEEMRGFIKSLKHLQEALGEWNDWRVLREEIEKIAPGAPYRAVQGFPLLIEQLDVQCKRHLHAFEEQDADFRATMKRAKKLFRTPVAPCCHWKEK